MTEDDSAALDKMISLEQQLYIKNFFAFSKPNKSVKEQNKISKKDIFFSAFFMDELAGFYCLRGFDNNFRVPSFGVYVNSRFQKRGIATLAIKNSIEWCEKNSVECIMLKVESDNIRALAIYKKSKFKFKRKCGDTGHLIFERRIN